MKRLERRAGIASAAQFVQTGLAANTTTEAPAATAALGRPLVRRVDDFLAEAIPGELALA